MKLKTGHWLILAMLACFAGVALWGFCLVRGLISCDDKVLETIRSPDGSMQAVYYTRDCGATTATSYNIALLPEGKSLASDKGKPIMTATDLGDVKIRWDSAKLLNISYKGGRFFMKNNSVDGVRVSYRQQ